MRACILTTSFPAYEGHFQSQFIAELAKAMSKLAEVTVICPKYKISRQSEESFGNVKIKRFTYFPIKFQTLTEGGGLASNMEKNILSYIQLPFFLLSMFFKLIREIKNHDVIFAQWALAGMVAVFAGFFFKKPVILTTRGADVNMSLKNPVFKKILVAVMRCCNHITSNNEDLIKKVNELGIKNTTVVRNGVDTDRFKPGDKTELRKKLGLPLNKKIIIYIGWFIERKGVKYLVSAMPKIIMGHKNTHFLLIGEGIMRAEIEKQIETLGIKEFTQLTGAKLPAEVPDWLCAADILILPSMAEGFPNVVLEAMASGVSVVATNVSGTPELLKDGFNGYLIEPKNPEQIAEKINKILETPETAEKMGKNGRQMLFDKGLSWDNSAKKYIEIASRFLNTH